MLRNQNDEEDDLDNGSESRLDEYARDLGHLPRILLASEAEQVRNWNHGDVTQRKDGEWVTWEREVQDKSYRYDGPEQIRPFCCITARPPGHMDEMRGLEAGATALTIRLDVLWHDMLQKRRRFGMVVIGRHPAQGSSMPMARRCQGVEEEANVVVRLVEGKPSPQPPSKTPKQGRQDASWPDLDHRQTPSFRRKSHLKFILLEVWYTSLSSELQRRSLRHIYNVYTGFVGHRL